MSSTEYYTDADLSRRVDPRNIKPWQLFEYRYERPADKDKTETIKEVHLRLPSRYGASMKTIKLNQEGKWELETFHFALDDTFADDDFRLIKGKQLRMSIQDAVMGFRILDAESK